MYDAIIIVIIQYDLGVLITIITLVQCRCRWHGDLDL